MPATDPDELPEGSQLAALDIGSNSFHLIVARYEHGELRPSQVLGEKVQLGAGLQNGRLEPDAIQRGLDCLSRFSQMLQSVEPRRLRVVGTNALRQAKNRREFTEPARAILGAPVEVIYGREEARLVYLGVAHTLADDTAARLVVDIGGGSTEFIVGERFEPRRLESLQMGCVSYTARHFADGRLDRREYEKAYDRACVEVSHIRKAFRSKHWQECVGSSGTLQAIEAMVTGEGWSEGGITRKSLARLRKQVLTHKRVDELSFSGLSEARRPVISAGIAITEAIFEVLEIEHMRTSKGALREGVLYDLLGRLRHEDVRERSINAMQQRYSADAETAALVARRARMLFEAGREAWRLGAEDGELVERAALTHEIGMAISHKHFHRHGAYLLRNSDMPGFSQGEQEHLALLVAGHRGKLKRELLDELDGDEGERLARMIGILRLAALFKYVELLEELPDFHLGAQREALALEFPAGWLEQHPLTWQELQQEQRAFERLGLALSFS
ncbi:Ppx/GppA phosphatase family protein [Pseudohaliea sp.]|uniref:Ppx/GppA phosphatase family protein n=1 Tax=Pseudohaliea sp. TaxID=2740289 RepID=UPI0032EF362B